MKRFHVNAIDAVRSVLVVLTVAGVVAAAALGAQPTESKPDFSRVPGVVINHVRASTGFFTISGTAIVMGVSGRF